MLALGQWQVQILKLITTKDVARKRSHRKKSLKVNMEPILNSCAHILTEERACFLIKIFY